VEVISAVDESVETLLHTAASALLLDLRQVRKVVAAVKEAFAGANSEQVKRIMSEIQLAEAVLDATEFYVDVLIVISREHRQTFLEHFTSGSEEKNGEQQFPQSF
jgi:hypothetical protein